MSIGLIVGCVVIGYLLIMVLWSIYNWSRGYWPFNWIIFGVGFAIFKNTGPRWSNDLGFYVPYWLYRRLKMRSCCIRICRLWDVPEDDLPDDYRKQILAHRKQLSSKKAILS
jgi:hypothetical protein